LGISVTDETLERATRVKRLIGRPQEALLCAKAKRQQHGFCLCESEATATRFLSVRKRSDSNNKAPSRNGNQPHVMVMTLKGRGLMNGITD